MQVDLEQELDLKIPLQPFLEEISCPICFNTITNCLMTSCGHNFCSHCLLECINRNHKCPCCNASQTKENLVRNVQFDKLISIIEKEKENSSKSYFEDLISQGSGNTKMTTVTSTDGASQNDNVSPIEEIFRRYLKKSILSFEGFYQEMNKKFKDNLEKLDREHQELVDKMTASGNPPGYKVIIDQSSKSIEMKRVKLEASFKESTDLILRSLEEYLKQNAVTPGFVTIYTSIAIPEKGVVFDHVPLKPSQTVADIKLIIQEKLNARGGDFAFLQWTETIHFSVEIPASLGSQLIELNDHNRPISLYNIPAGSKIILGPGSILLKGDQPKDCFITTYKPGSNDVMTYYRCEDCASNWICKPCAEYCHKGHNLRIHIPNHKASYACCYDQRIKKCKINK